MTLKLRSASDGGMPRSSTVAGRDDVALSHVEFGSYENRLTVATCSPGSAGVAGPVALDNSSHGLVAVLDEGGLGPGSAAVCAGPEADTSETDLVEEATGSSSTVLFGCTMTIRSPSSAMAPARPRLRCLLPCGCPWLCI